jgi:hypothetical protein
MKHNKTQFVDTASFNSMFAKNEKKEQKNGSIRGVHQIRQPI